jgi:small subunit ribosomal protein S17
MLSALYRPPPLPNETLHSPSSYPRNSRKANTHQHFSKTQHLLVHDPRSSLRTGDIISISPGFRASKRVHHVVNSILAPFGEPIDARPAVPTGAERLKEIEEKRRRKGERKMAEGKAEKEGEVPEKSLA